MRTRIKICGFTCAEDAWHAAQSGADAIGLVFYPPSPRYVSLDSAKKIAAVIPPFVSRVGLFVDASVEAVRQVLRAGIVDVLQFHGNESPDWCRQFDRPYIKAIRVQPGLNLLQCATDYADAQGLLLDAWVDGVPGGTGARFDWQMIPQKMPLPWILSGGLSVDNVAQAIRDTRPWAVDVSSGVEQQRGVKDRMKMTQFVKEVQRADN